MLGLTDVALFLKYTKTLVWNLLRSLKLNRQREAWVSNMINVPPDADYDGPRISIPPTPEDMTALGVCLGVGECLQILVHRSTSPQ